MITRILVLVAALPIYLFAFWQQERESAAAVGQLDHPLPPVLQQVALGYLRQLGGEMQFIKAAVFLGGIETERHDPMAYAAPLAARLDAAARLHPHFIDSYFLNQAMLPDINDEYAHYANRIHAVGMTALPDDYMFPFFIGFNHFYHLRDSAQAAHYLQEASRLPGAPSWFGHLAGTLAGEGGDIYGGLFWLRAMLAGEEEESLQQRYRHSISMFERAVVVHEALQAYQARQGQYPSTLDELVPKDLPVIPELDPPFQLDWQPPTLRLLRQGER